MSRTSAIALGAPSSPLPAVGFVVRQLDWSAVGVVVIHLLGAIGEGVRMAWWDGSAVGVHLNGLLGLFEADVPALGEERAKGRV